jgi:ADP-ribose pyrophosphatase YjhB (NUDIX family)
MSSQIKDLNIVQSRAIVFNSKNELLLVSKNGTRWSLPGGTVNKHYQLDQLAADEVFEETGLSVKVNYLAYYLQEKWDVNNGFWHFNERIEHPFTGHCLVLAYYCEIIGNENLDPNWIDKDHNVIKFKKFVNESEFLDLLLNKNIAQDELLELTFQKIKRLKNQHLFI